MDNLSEELLDNIIRVQKAMDEQNVPSEGRIVRYMEDGEIYEIRLDDLGKVPQSLNK